VRLRLLSDLHLEYDPWVPPAAEEQGIVVLAGDVHNGRQGIAWAARHFACPVVYVPGNHEYDLADMQVERATLRQADCPAHVHVLDNRSVVIEGVRFLGTTLWTDFALDGNADQAMFEAARCMTDYTRIRYGNRALTPHDTIALHHAARTWLERELAQPFDGATVVVSHHCPHATCVATKFRNSPANPGFASDLSELFSAYSIAAWCHGHTHCSLDHYVGETRIICNPRGYAQNGQPENERFDPALIVEI
jgi:UDP-2,3-diacylglucosamine pyrophosphatase LpxH